MINYAGLKVESTIIERFAEIAAGVGMVVIFAMPIYLWNDLPATIPRHFAADGSADAYSGKAFLLFLPFVCLFFYSLLAVLKRFTYRLNYPWKISPDNVYRQFQLAKGFIAAIKAVLIWIFVYIEWVQVGVALGRTEGIDPWLLPVVIFAVLGVISVYFYLAYHSK